MPNHKKKGQTQGCMSPAKSRRMLIKSMEIKDIPQRMLCASQSFATPSPSTSHSCNCNEEYCTPNDCGKPKPCIQVCAGPHGQLTTVCPRTCKKFDGEVVDDMACCQEMLRKLARESLALNQVEKRVSIQEPHETGTCLLPGCVENNPEPGKAPCLSQSYPQLKPPPTQPMIMCPGCKDMLEPEDEGLEETCSVDSCKRNMKSKTNIHCLECESKDKVPELSSICNNQRLRTMPLVTPIPSRNLTGSIASNTSETLSWKLLKKDKKAKKEEKRNMKNISEQSCNHEKCIANKDCPCRFPPAYSQYYNCTGQISGNCTCGENK